MHLGSSTLPDYGPLRLTGERDPPTIARPDCAARGTLTRQKLILARLGFPVQFRSSNPRQKSCRP